MRNAELMLDIVTSLRGLATSIEAASATMLMDAENDTPAPVTVEKTPMPKAFTLEQVRAILAEKSLTGFTDEIRNLLLKHGAQKLSQIDPANYEALLTDIEALK